MKFWRDPDTDRRRYTQEVQEAFLDAISSPRSLEILYKALDYLEAVRVNTRLKRTDDTMDAGLQEAIRLLRDCGQSVLSNKEERQ